MCVNVLIQVPTLVFIQESEQQHKLVLYIVSEICCCHVFWKIFFKQ